VPRGGAELGAYETDLTDFSLERSRYYQQRRQQSASLFASCLLTSAAQVKSGHSVIDLSGSG
jgi:hypothetical protein